jgi:heme/copper-type cytochrome/quinol oxidase subunit 3
LSYLFSLVFILLYFIIVFFFHDFSIFFLSLFYSFRICSFLISSISSYYSWIYSCLFIFSFITFIFLIYYYCKHILVFTSILLGFRTHLLRLVFWKSIHLEVASGPFCLLVNSPWLLVFSILLVSFLFTGFNLYCWAGIHFSWSNSLIFIYLLFGLIFSFHIWSRDLLRELAKKYEILLMVLFLLFGGVLVSEALLFVSFFWASFHSLSSPTLGIWPGESFYLPDPCELTFANTLLLSNAAVSLGGAFVSLEISSALNIFFSLFSFILAWTFISLQIKEFRIMGLSINDSIYSCLFFFLTGLHFFHLLLGLLLLSLLFWSCSFHILVCYVFINNFDTKI